MNRREALQTGLAVLTAAGVDGEVATLAPRNPQAFVIRTTSYISCATAQRLREEWRECFKGTALAGIPCIVLEAGASLEVIDKID